MKRPNAVDHMASHGFVLGYILSLIYSWTLIAIQAIFIGNVSVVELTGIFGLFVALSCLSGAMPGLIIGVIDGCVLWFFTHRIQFPIGDSAFQQWHNLARVVIAVLTFAGILTFLTPLLFLSAEGKWLTGIVYLSLPAVIAMVASIYAVNRYMAQLRKWSRIPVEYPKAKRKPKNQLVYDAPEDLLVAETEFKQDSSSTVQG